MGQKGLNILGEPKARSFSDPILRAFLNHVLVNLKNTCIIYMLRFISVYFVWVL